MKTPEMWLEEVLASADKLDDWLVRQYIGEKLAAERIAELSMSKDLSEDAQIDILSIALDERTHAAWIKALLQHRALPIPDVSMEKDRYWKEVLPNALTLDQKLAAGYHAETMRLHRIRLLASDKRVPGLISQIFRAILADEERHAEVFARYASVEAIAEMAEHHEAGLSALGLEI